MLSRCVISQPDLLEKNPKCKDRCYIPVATLYFLLTWRPARTSSSVRVGCRRLWSNIFDRSSREILSLIGHSITIFLQQYRLMLVMDCPDLSKLVRNEVSWSPEHTVLKNTVSV